ncbi:MAG: MFS transporter, partial [Candidatus Dormibacteraeota bacterium]|nr:MFS transporter [Candidatus Dormibacteraeota bacterium]
MPGPPGMLRRRWSLLRRHPEFAKLWAGDLVSVFGSAITTVALPLTAVVVLHAGAFQMGVLAAAGTLPPLLFGLVAGVWIDRFPRRLVLIVGDVGRALLLGTIPVLALLGRLRIEVLYLVAFLVGLLSFLFLIAAASVTPALVDREDLMQANSATALNSSLGSTAGPALAGALVQLL